MALALQPFRIVPRRLSVPSDPWLEAIGISINAVLLHAHCAPAAPRLLMCCPDRKGERIVGLGRRGPGLRGCSSCSPCPSSSVRAEGHKVGVCCCPSASTSASTCAPFNARLHHHDCNSFRVAHQNGAKRILICTAHPSSIGVFCVIVFLCSSLTTLSDAPQHTPPDEQTKGPGGHGLVIEQGPQERRVLEALLFLGAFQPLSTRRRCPTPRQRPRQHGQRRLPGR